METINASTFKAQCLAILDRVAATGETIVIVKHGRPVARLTPPLPAAEGYPQDDLAGTVVFHGDVIEPVLPAEAWKAVRGKLD